jgi:NADH-quinone oxidoreductase subunit L
MQVAMGVLAILASVAGLALLPYGILVPLEHFLEPAFHDSRFYEELHPSDALTTAGLLIGAAAGVLGILLAYTIWVRRPGTSARMIERFPRVHALLVNQWYFDEILDRLFTRPTLWFGRWAQSWFERIVVQGALVDGTTGLVRAGSAAVRAAQSGLLRAYAALFVVGLTAVGLYFLLQA